MKILLHCNYDPFESIGGIETVCRDIARSLKSEHEITIIASGSTNQKYSYDGMKILRLKSLLTISGANFALFQNFRLLFFGLRSDKIVIQEPCPSYWPAIFFLSIFKSQDTTVFVHALPKIRFVRLKKIYNKIFSLIHRRNYLVTSSPNLSQNIHNDYSLKSDIVPFCVPDPSGMLCILDEEIPVLPDRFCLYIGRFAKYKGLDMVVSAANSLPHVKFVVAGDGELADFMVRSECPNLTIINKLVSESTKRHLIKCCDFLLFPSNSPNEAFGIIQLEALANGKPIINTRLGTGVNWVAPEGITGVAVDVNDQKNFALVIDKLWSNSVARESYGKNARRRYVDNFSPGKFSNFWINHFRKCYEEDKN